MAERKSVLLRISPQLWEELQRLASQELRSVNAQIEYLLVEALRRRGRMTSSESPEIRSGAKSRSTVTVVGVERNPVSGTT